MSAPIDPSSWSCPLPLRAYPTIVLGHGGGGKLSADLIQHLLVPAFHNEVLADLGDAALLRLDGGTLAMSTDSFVVKPLFFPGGNIGELAIYGTVNDLSMGGATPRYLTVGLILEEGLPLAVLGVIVESMAAAARRAGVFLVAGDTKVVDKGHGDGIYINTSGIGTVATGIDIRPQRAAYDDLVIVSGTVGDHGMAIMSVREGLQFESDIRSDTAPLNDLVQTMLEADGRIHVLRDPTRGGVASALNEIASAAHVGIQLDESRIPVAPAVHSACEMLGMDPLYVANEGKLVALVDPDAAPGLLEAMHRHPLGRQAAIIGRVVDQHPGLLTAKTVLGGTRVVPLQIGEQLPRIC